MKSFFDRFALLLPGLACVLILVEKIALAQPENIKFERIGIEAGLSNNAVYCLYQDSRGFMWFGTQDGLNRYDGYNFKVYRHDPQNPASLSDYAINKIVEDPLQPGTLWIATREGLNRFDREKETFTHFRHDPNRPGSLSNNRVRELYIGRDGVLWIGTDNGLNKFNREEETFTAYIHDPQNADGLAFKIAGTCLEDNDGNLWIGGLRGLDILDPETGRIAHFREDPDNPHRLSNDNITRLYKSPTGQLWAGSYYGLFQIDPAAQRDKGGQLIYYQYKPGNPEAGNFNYVSAIFEDREGLLWLGFVFGGLLIFDPIAETFTEYPLIAESAGGAGPESVRSIIEDRSAVLWIGTDGQGVFKHDIAGKPFTTYRHVPNKPHTLIGNEVTAILEDRGAIWWIGTNVGLSRFDKRSGEIEHFRQEENDAGSLSSNNVQSVFRDSRGDLWVGTFGGGLNKLNPATGKFSHYRHQPDNPASLANDFIHVICEDRSGNLWIGTGAGGLDKFDRSADGFVHYPQNPDRQGWLKSNEINCIYEDHQGLLWLGTTMWGLYCFDPQQERFLNFMHELHNPQSLSSNRVISLYQDKSQTLWVGTFGGGLNRFDRATNTFTHFTEKDGLPGNSIHGILEDEQGNLWLSADKGLGRFDPKTKTVRNYYTSDGLPSNQLSLAAYRCQDGAMLFGSNNGLLHFYPDSIKDNPFIPPLALTDFQIFGQSVTVAGGNGQTGGKSILEKSIGEAEKVELSFDQNVFTFEFAALHFAAPFKNQYAYKMEGFDRDWIYAGNRRFAAYTNLDPGEYIFRVKGSNSDGVWNEEGTASRVIIRPPWWRTTTAYLAYVLLLAAALLAIRRFEMNRIKMRNRLRMKEFEAQKLQEIDHLKSRFFANISHEFRTPLTLILGPLSDLLARTRDAAAATELKIMQRSAGRLLLLINQLLDLSRLESGRMVLRAAHGDLVSFLRGIVMAFASLAEQKGIDLRFSEGVSDRLSPGWKAAPPPEIYFDRDKIEKIFFNLLSNAFKFTPEGGSVEVAVDIPPDPPSKGGTGSAPPFEEFIPELREGRGGMLEIRVRDTGSGIPAEQLSHIFERFYQVDDFSPVETLHATSLQGTGIGLALVKELVELHHGEITVSSQPGKGTTFTVRLPLGKEHLRAGEIVDPTIADFGFPDTSGESEIETSPIPNPKPVVSKVEPSQIVLIVDDHPDVRYYLRKQLEAEYQITEAADGAEGLETARETIPDLVISDVMMPGMNGQELCKALKTSDKTSHIPVILLTARAGEQDKLAGLETGADDYLIKPFNSRELRIRVHNLIEIRRKLQEHYRKEGLLAPRDLPVTSIEQAFLQKLRQVLEQHLAEEDFGIDVLCRELAMSPRQLQRKIRALTDESPTDLIRSARLERAKYLLEQHSGNVSEIAFAVGFNNLSYFARSFRERFGVSPSQFIRHTGQ